MKPAPEQLYRLIDMIKYENMTCPKCGKKRIVKDHGKKDTYRCLDCGCRWKGEA